MFGAVTQSAAYDGGEAEDWHAPALNEKSQIPIPWSQLQLVNYLFDGWDEEHGIAAGPMAPVVNHLYDQSEDDIFAIAAYFESLQRRQLAEAEKNAVLERARSLDWGRNSATGRQRFPMILRLLRGMDVFADQCATCHKSGIARFPCLWP